MWRQEANRRQWFVPDDYEEEQLEQEELVEEPNPSAAWWEKEYRVTIMGDGAVGKSALAIAFKDGGFFLDTHCPTIFEMYGRA